MPVGWCFFGLDGFRTGLTGTDADGLFDWGNENLPVPNAAGFGGLANGFNCAFNLVVIDDNFDFHLGQKVDDIFSAAIELCVTFLAAKALGFKNGDTLQAYFLESFLHFVELEWFDDCFNLFHAVGSLSIATRTGYLGVVR